MSPTLLSSNMDRKTWLCTVIVPLSSKPSAELQRFMSLCNRDVTTDVLRRADIILEAIFPSCARQERSPHSTLMYSVWEQSRLEAKKLYYRVLHAICTAEAKFLHTENLTCFLANDCFHRCLLACSAELVLATYNTVPMLFPAVFERIGITAFDLIKVIENFITHEETLPRELKSHLNSLEEQFLESTAWKKGSSLYNSLRVARPSLSAEINRLGLPAEPMPCLDTIAIRGHMSSVSSVQNDEAAHDHSEGVRSPKRLRSGYQSILVERNSFTSPAKDRRLALDNMNFGDVTPALPHVNSSSTRPTLSGRVESIAIKMFFSKVLKLAAVRIDSMGERLQQSDQTRKKIFLLFQEILNQRTDLFFNRHIDQIILCCFYGVAKQILQQKLTSPELLSSYRKQPHYQPQVFYSVFIGPASACHDGKLGHDHMSIINFYNQVFRPAVQHLLVQLPTVGTAHTDAQGAEADNENHCPMTPKMMTSPNLPDLSPKKVSAAHNVYVSPMRSSKMETLKSRWGRSYYAYVGEKTEAYKSPSKDLTAINNHLKCTSMVRRALNFDDSRFISDSSAIGMFLTKPDP